MGPVTERLQWEIARFLEWTGQRVTRVMVAADVFWAYVKECEAAESPARRRLRQLDAEREPFGRVEFSGVPVGMNPMFPQGAVVPESDGKQWYPSPLPGVVGMDHDAALERAAKTPMGWKSVFSEEQERTARGLGAMIQRHWDKAEAAARATCRKPGEHAEDCACAALSPAPEGK